MWFEQFKTGLTRSKQVSAGLVWFEPVKTGLSRLVWLKPVKTDSSLSEPVWSGLIRSNQIKIGLNQ